MPREKVIDLSQHDCKSEERVNVRDVKTINNKDTANHSFLVLGGNKFVLDSLTLYSDLLSHIQITILSNSIYLYVHHRLFCFYYY